MSYINQQNQEFARKLLKIATLAGSRLILRRADKSSDTSTELLHEIGTTDVAIGDATAETMLTTMGKIPNEMFYLEDTAPNVKVTTHKIYQQETPQYAYAVVATTDTISNNEYASHSSVLLALLTALLIILLLCCTTACLIAKSKRKNNFFGKADTECEPGCSGINQPLLDKVSDCTNKTSVSSLRN